MADTQTHGAPSVQIRAIKSRLLGEHLEVEQLLTQLTNALDGGDSATIAEVWTQFERRVRDHMHAEERYLFPRVARAHWQEIEGLKFEHQRIRCALDDLGTLVDLHALRKTSVDELSLYLLQHAAGEECSLYQWVDDSPVALGGLRALLAQRAAHESGSDD